MKHSVEHGENAIGMNGCGAEVVRMCGRSGELDCVPYSILTHIQNCDDTDSLWTSCCEAADSCSKLDHDREQCGYNISRRCQESSDILRGR